MGLKQLRSIGCLPHLGSFPSFPSWVHGSTPWAKKTSSPKAVLFRLRAWPFTGQPKSRKIIKNFHFFGTYITVTSHTVQYFFDIFVDSDSIWCQSFPLPSASGNFTSSQLLSESQRSRHGLPVAIFELLCLCFETQIQTTLSVYTINQSMICSFFQMPILCMMCGSSVHPIMSINYSKVKACFGRGCGQSFQDHDIMDLGPIWHSSLKTTSSLLPLGTPHSPGS